MANLHKGEVAFKAGDDEYKLSFSANALAELETMLDMSVIEIGEIMRDPNNLRMTRVRTIFRAGLLDHQPGIDEKKTAEIFSKISFLNAIDLMNRAFVAALPQAEAGGGDADPPKPDSPKDGTGPAS